MLLTRDTPAHQSILQRRGKGVHWLPAFAIAAVLISMVVVVILSYFCPVTIPLGPYRYYSTISPNRSPFKRLHISVMPMHGGGCLWIREANAIHGIALYIPRLTP